MRHACQISRLDEPVDREVYMMPTVYRHGVVVLTGQERFKIECFYVILNALVVDSTKGARMPVLK